MLVSKGTHNTIKRQRIGRGPHIERDIYKSWTFGEFQFDSQGVLRELELNLMSNPTPSQMGFLYSELRIEVCENGSQIFIVDSSKRSILINNKADDRATEVFVIKALNRHISDLLLSLDAGIQIERLDY